MLTPLFGISALPEPYPRVPSCFQRLFICRIPLQAYRAPVSPSFPASFRARRLCIVGPVDQRPIHRGAAHRGISSRNRGSPAHLLQLYVSLCCMRERQAALSFYDRRVLRSMSPILIITDCVYCMSNRLCILYVQQTVYTVWPRRSDPF